MVTTMGPIDALKNLRTEALEIRARAARTKAEKLGCTAAAAEKDTPSN
jgi:hypothetical protein